MHLVITSNDPRNTEFTTEDGHLWYTVDTPWRIGKRTSTFTRFQPEPVAVGQVTWGAFDHTRVRIGSTALDRGDFLRRKAVFSTHRLMTGSDGLEYEWKELGSEPELWSTATGRCVAYYRRRNVFKGRKAMLTIEPEAERMMDVIVIALTLLEEAKRGRRAGANAAIAANA